MPVALNVDKEAVRVLCKAIGVRRAAREMGISEKTVLHWSMIYGWAEEERAIELVREKVLQSSSVKSPSEALASVLEDHEKETKLSLARAARSNAMEAELAGLAGASDALATGKLAALVHGWQSTGGTTVNVAVALRMDME